MSYSLIGLNESVFVESAISGNALMLLTTNSLPSLTGVEAPANSTVVLALLNSRFVVPVFSISYPLTYALPGEICMINLFSTPPCFSR